MTIQSARTRVAMALLALASPALALAQANEAVKTDIAVQVTNARKAIATLMQTYSWNSRTELLEDGTVKDTRVELVNYVNGQMQRSLVSDQGRRFRDSACASASPKRKKRT